MFSNCLILCPSRNQQIYWQCEKLWLLHVSLYSSDETVRWSTAYSHYVKVYVQFTFATDWIILSIINFPFNYSHFGNKIWKRILFMRKSVICHSIHAFRCWGIFVSHFGRLNFREKGPVLGFFQHRHKAKKNLFKYFFCREILET